MRSMSGSPVWNTSPIADTEPTFWTTTPTVTGSLPEGTSTPVTAWMSIFSAPCGYLTVSGRMVMSRSSGTVRRSASIASGLFFSTPMTHLCTPIARIITRMPKCTRPGYSTIVRWSDVRYGSHSAPLMMSVCTSTSFGGASFTCVGKAAPPSPTTPASWTACTTCSVRSASQYGTSRGRTICGAYRSTSIRTASAIVPSGCGHQSTSTTVPAADAWIGTDMKPSASPTLSPRSTRSPTLTHTIAGLPACCRRGSTISSG